MSFQHHLKKPLIVAVTVIILAACVSSPTIPVGSAEPETNFDTLVSTEWLSAHLDDPDLVVLDCSVIVQQDQNGSMQILSGRDSYESGHIPHAGFADLMGDLSDSESPYRFALPSPEKFAAAMGALGVGDDSRVVLYDSFGSGWAARVWWMLRWIGFDRAAILDGGLGAWTAEGRPLSVKPVDRSARQLSVAVRPELIADRDEVLAAVDSDDINIIDALPAAHYRGEIGMYERAGHIPGAANIPAMSLLDESGRYLDSNELEKIIGIDRNERAITYCGGGISASSDAFILHRLGFTDVAVYIHSLQEWAADPANPLEVDE